MDNETPIPTVDDMEGQKDETDKCITCRYCEISTKECYIWIEGMLGLEQGVLSFNISHARCIYSPYAINYSQFVNYLTILTRKYMGNVKSNAV